MVYSNSDRDEISGDFEDDWEEDYPYPPGEAYENAIEAADEIYGIPDPRLIED
ncbi:hypothetical protein [Lyngbya sp. CCY1209]|jgi:hypothetical protein|uniref:hypothetical protein n=1 Tax=Lyngbya sp. CCY1209 TaxID=2886103 RepID=UPI002D1FDA8A|nr:hypothetical protein [Lyngbya sp. CCY1209]MEB3886220.1 hypothetical protein [Lyngbya sp. CCY1209]